MDSYYCYFTVGIDSGFDSDICLEYSMGGIPTRLAYNSNRLLSYLLVFYLIKNKLYQLEDIVFLSKNGIAWQIEELETGLSFVTGFGSVIVGIFDQISMPNFDRALIGSSVISINEVKIIQKIHFECLKDMYEPNFDLT